MFVKLTVASTFLVYEDNKRIFFLNLYVRLVVIIIRHYFLFYVNKKGIWFFFHFTLQFFKVLKKNVTA